MKIVTEILIMNSARVSKGGQELIDLEMGSVTFTYRNWEKSMFNHLNDATYVSICIYLAIQSLSNRKLDLGTSHVQHLVWKNNTMKSLSQESNGHYTNHNR